MRNNVFKLFCLSLTILFLSGCSSQTVNYDIGSRDINDVINTDIYQNVNSSMDLSEVSVMLGGYSNFFEEENEIKNYEFYLDAGILTAIIEPSDNSWHTSYLFKPYNLEVDNFFKIDTEFIPENQKWVYIKQGKKNKIMLILKGDRINDVWIY